MRIVLQRVTRASVTVDGAVTGEIGRGFLALVGSGKGEADTDPEQLAAKVAGLRVFSDEAGKMNLALGDVDGGVLVVSQFTLYGDTSKGRRPSFIKAEDPVVAAERVERFAAALEGLGVPVARGVFGADMAVELVNDGPVTLVLEGSAEPGG